MKYIEVSNKGVAQVLNAKAFDLCATAMSYTPRTTADQLTKEMKAIEIVSNIKNDATFRKSQRSGTLYNKRKDKFGNTKITINKNFYKNKPELRYASSKTHKVPVGFLIANYRRKLRGKAALGGPKMGIYFDKFIKALRKSAGYIRAGWIPALETFRPFAKSKEARMAGLRASRPILEASKSGRSRMLSQNGGIAATIGTFPVLKATIYNFATGADIIERRDSPLQRALTTIEMDMRKAIESYLQKEAKARGF